MKTIFYSIYSLILCFPVTTHALEKPSNPGLASVNTAAGIIGKIINFVTSFIAGIAILMIIISGIMYMVSVGDETRIETAKKMLTYSVGGLVVVLLAYVIVYLIWYALEGTPLSSM